MAHIRRFSKPGKQVGFDKYANYAAIVQSSGTGKSRLVDEFAKKNLVIRMNFRNDASSGNLMFDMLDCAFLIQL
jgi:hypothetical protein